ncbi:MAG: amidohydrolase [Chloroflexota bacterium]|nr:MAG: amidohydrolase [Chloroflexota bacterium]
MAVESPLPAIAPARPATIDAEIHNVVSNTEALFPYLSEHWRESITQTLFKGAVDAAFPRNAPTTARPNSGPPGVTPGSSLSYLQANVLDPMNVETAILACTYAVDSLRNPDAAIAFASAINDWQIAEWLDRDSRLRASIVVPSQLPADAAREIERVGDHPGFVQVLMPVRSHQPYGNRNYHEMFGAVARKDLVAGIHFGGHPGNPPTPSGWPSHYVEEYIDMAGVFASQVTSIITEGVFDQYPTLRVALLEAGFTWIPAHMWRFDKEWRNLRRLVPWVRRSPSSYIREHIRVTVQPLDAPTDPRMLLGIIEQLECDEMLMYASDFPHLHRFDAEADLLTHLPTSLATKIRRDNARSFYRL